MTNQIIERIKIIEDFKSIYEWKGKTQERKDKTLKFIAFLDYRLAMFILIFLILVSTLTSFQIETASGNWENAGLLVLMAMSLSLRAPFAYIELILKKHIDEIKHIDKDFEKKLNQDLEFLILKFNDRKKYLYLIGLPAILILIAALLQVFDLNPYWDKFPHLVGGVSVYILVRMNYNIIRLKRNLRRVKFEA
ncbi:hypothetical protein [Carboxylicivirga marina]|uniref:hypothetical protein n=1 Tax=Carboxylicivirga marina TaxID=2800988 RepID=UPI00259290BD|nr:hypothetical protein [uncultured Carboxylicivirga sp.]